MTSIDNIEALALHDEWNVHWDGDPKMGGGFHVCSIGTGMATLREAEDIKATYERLDPRGDRHPNLRIVHRMVSKWTS